MFRAPIWKQSISGSISVTCRVSITSTQIGIPKATLNYTVGDWMFGHLLYGLMAWTFALPAMIPGPKPSGAPYRFLTLRSVSWLGLVSYGVFLYHMPFAGKFLRAIDWFPALSFPVYTALVFAAALACATASYYLLERPLMRWGDKRDRSRRAKPDRVEAPGAG